MKILTEHETLRLLLEGRSIARFGDGEMDIAKGGYIKSQQYSLSLTRQLIDILECKGDYIVAIPRLTSRSPKFKQLSEYEQRYRSLLISGQEYGSSLMTRPDSAPWIDTDEYWRDVIRLWKDKHIAFIWGGGNKSLVPRMMKDASELDVIQSLPRNAWEDRSGILERIDALDPKPQVAVMCLGPTATALVPELVHRGIQALDLGHIGMFMKRALKDEKEFKAAHGFWWPSGAEEYGKRYIRRTEHMDEAIGLCKKRRSVVQAGGHVGVWPKYLSRYFDNVYTFEPDNMNFTAMCRNTPERNVFKMQAALGLDRGRVDLVLHPNNIGGHHIKGEGRIPQIRIDDLCIDDCDLMVLDIEGSELDAIRGAEETISRCHPTLHLELRGHIEKYRRGTTEELRELLSGHGYEEKFKVGDDTVFKWAGPQR